ncbi:MAG: DNA polymerase III subunit gamma/tau, partial [Candidatus Cloacimonetes bacterium]|nr:DNA polymerase III subunit gamma/tau [Candidatus Cloacimonadota bacterium]
MSYIVLARKYRPQTFAEVYAQNHVTRTIQNAIDMKRIAHAYLFAGPRGVGKTSMARILSKSLNCVNGPTKTPCNECENCLEITSGISPDVIEIDGASTTGVDNIRELQKELMYSTTKSKYRIYIIDEVHMLSKGAFNALLKTLEEPPENIVFIFATTEPHKILPTIISRCQRYDFRRIPIEPIVAQLKDICAKENLTVNEDALFVVAKKADGSMRDALSLMDQVLSFGGDNFTEEDVQSIFGILHSDVYLTILTAIVKKETTEMLSVLHTVIEAGNDLLEFFNGLIDMVRNAMLLKLKVDTAELPKVIKQELTELTSHFEEEELLYMVSFLMKLKYDVRYSGNPVLLAEMGMIKLSRIAELKSIDELLELINSKPEPQQEIIYRDEDLPEIESEIREIVNTREKSKLAEEVMDGHEYGKELSREVLETHWDKLIKTVGRQNPMIKAHIAGASV